MKLVINACMFGCRSRVPRLGVLQDLGACVIGPMEEAWHDPQKLRDNSLSYSEGFVD